MADEVRITAIVNDLVGCLCSGLVDSPGGVTCFCGVVPGAIVPMDFCDCSDTACGMAWVRLVDAFPSVNFPNRIQDLTSCAAPLAAIIELGVTRCLPGMDESGNPPNEAVQAEAVRIQYGDLEVMRKALLCCQIGTRKRPAVLGRYTPVVNQGNCGGGTWQFTVKV